MYINYKKEFKKLYKSKEENYYCMLHKEIYDKKNDSKEFWRLVKKVNNSNQLKVNNNNHISPERWLNYFKLLLNTDVIVDPVYNNDVQLFMENHDLSCNDCLENVPIDVNRYFTIEEITCFVKKLPNRKACGIDGVCNEIIKAGIHILAPHLMSLFNSILTSGEFPNEWCKAILVPVHQTGSRSDESNYRGISIVPCISKIFTGIINERLYIWAESNQKLYENQAGFRENCSTIDHLFTFQAIVQKYVSKKHGRFYCIYVDFSKAFDRVPHMYLFARLLKNGLHGNIINVLRSMYSKILSTVNTPEGITQFFESLIGTMQGCMLSPLLFVLYLNQFVEMCNEAGCEGVYIDEYFPNMFLLMYADDMIQCSDMIGRLQKQIDILSKYCNISGMKVNLNKTKVMVFRRGGIVKQNEVIYYNNELVEIVTYYKYLGLIVSSRLNWTKATQTLAAQSEKSIIVLKRFVYKCRGVSVDIWFKLFDSLITPIITYGAEIWGTQIHNPIENVQIRFCKYILGVSKNCNNNAVLGECGRYPMYITYYTKCIKYWCKLICMDNDRLPKGAYNMLLKLDENGRVNWVTNVKNLLYKYGFGFAFISQEIGDINIFVLNFKQRLIDCSKQDWHSELSNSSKLSTYCTFKTLLQPEKYLYVIEVKKFSRALAKLRLSNHCLEIENGRKNSVVRNERYCKYCLNNNFYYVEDEFHFVCICNLYNNIRSKYLPAVINMSRFS